MKKLRNYVVTFEFGVILRLNWLFSVECWILETLWSYCIVLYCIELYCLALYFIVLHCIVLYCIVLYCIVSNSYLYYFKWHLFKSIVAQLSISAPILSQLLHKCHPSRHQCILHKTSYAYLPSFMYKRFNF